MADKKQTMLYGLLTSIASKITYDNTTSGLEAENVQDAIDETNSVLANKNIKHLYSKNGTSSGQTISRSEYIGSSTKYLIVSDFSDIVLPSGTYLINWYCYLSDASLWYALMDKDTGNTYGAWRSYNAQNVSGLYMPPLCITIEVPEGKTLKPCIARYNGTQSGAQSFIIHGSTLDVYKFE